MKNKLLSLLLVFIIIFGFSACKKSNLYAPGEDTLEYSSKHVLNASSTVSKTDETEDKNDSSSTVSYKKPDKTWTPAIDGNESVQFGFKNKTEDYIVKIGYKPNTYKNYLYYEKDFNPNTLAAITLSYSDSINYTYWQFKFITADGKEIELNPIKIKNKKGINLIFMNGGYTYKYFK